MLPPPTLLGVPPGPAAQAWGSWLQIQESAPSGSAPACSRQEPGQHPDWIRVHAVPSPGRSLQEGGRSRGRRQRADPAKRACPVALAARGGGWPGSEAWGAMEPGPESGGFHASSLCPQVAPDSHVGTSGRAGGRGQSLAGQPQVPHHVPSHLGELGRIPGAKQVFSLPCQGRSVTDSLLSPLPRHMQPGHSCAALYSRVTSGGLRLILKIKDNLIDFFSSFY